MNEFETEPSVGTAPSSNLDEVLKTPLISLPAPVGKVFGSFALNIDSIDAAAEYRERMVGLTAGYCPKLPSLKRRCSFPQACTVDNLHNQHRINNSVFSTAFDEPVAGAFAEKSAQAMASMPEKLKELPAARLPFRPAVVMGWLTCRTCIKPRRIFCHCKMPSVSGPASAVMG